MNIKITTRACFHVPVTREQIAALIILAKLHYDHTCKSMADPDNGRLSQWDRMIKISLEYGEEGDIPTVEASFSDLDYCLKIMELTDIAAGFIDATQAKLCRDLRRDFHGALSLANGKYHEWQATYQGTAV